VQILKEFKQFAVRGNAIDLAIAVVIGTAFSKIVSALVDGIIMPCIGVLLGGINIANKTFTIHEAVVKWGALIQSIINFTIIAFALFMTIKLMNFLKLKQSGMDKKSIEDLLTEIRDLLKKSDRT
jgi:large conductance mechanosensitive channel